MRLLKLLVSIAVYIADSAWRVVLDVGRRPAAPICVILYYHSVPNEHRRAFAAQMNVLARLTVPISVERVPQFLSGRHYSAVTFDDGFEDVIKNAVPELETRAIPATVFVTTGYLGAAADWWPELARQSSERIAGAEEWKRLQRDLISIGSHTVTHPHLLGLSEMAAKRELQESREMLESMLHREISMFSFPYGEYNEDLIRWCKDAGYTRVFTITPANAFRTAGEQVIGRVQVEPTDWPLEFRLKLLGAYRWLTYAMTWKHKLLVGLRSRNKTTPIIVSST